MSQAKDLLNSLVQTQYSTRTLTPGEEPHIIINPDRTIVIPDELKEIAVQYEHNMETVTFDCPRYWDGRDLYTMNLYVNYQRPDKFKAPCQVENLRLNDTDESIIHFDWTITDEVTKVAGNIAFLVCGKIANSQGILERHWNTKPNQELIIAEGLECVEYISERYPDIIEKILLEMHDHIDTALTEAKASGEFDGEKGDPGVSVSITNVQESTENAGNNVVTFSDGNTLTVKNGTKGEDGYTPQKGVDYFDGKDGYTPVKGVDYFDGEDGYTPQKGVDYFDGKDGEDGYTPQKGIDYFDGEKGDKGEKGDPGYTPQKGVDYFDGKDGEDGYTPQKGVDYFDGEKGEKGDPGYTPQKGVDYFDGKDGEDGKDGYTPQKGVDYFDGKDGEDGYTPQKGIDYFDGEDGYTPQKGVDYFDGEDGKTPVKGVDYLTQEEIDEVAEQIKVSVGFYTEEMTFILNDGSQVTTHVIVK